MLIDGEIEVLFFILGEKEMDNGLLNLVLSSAVIVAIINLFIQNRNNKLQYITNYRSKWREQLRKSVANLEKSSRYDDKCRQIFTKIKINLHSPNP